MFWRFGFHNASTIDSLLDKEDVAVEAILDEDDLLQECKSQNTRLLDYFERVDVLQKLLGYVTGQIEGEEKGRFKYPYIATEVLCSEIWSIVETCVNEQRQLLVPFWETVLDRSPDDMKTQMVMASHFAKINAVFLTKKPAEMFAFIKSQPNIVERLLQHVETPSFADLLIRIIQLDEIPEGNGVLEWLSSENLVGRLVDLLSPQHTSDIHVVVADLIKGIISMATPSPGAGLTEGLQNGPASNCFARELANRGSITKLVSYMFYDFNSLEEDKDQGNTNTDDFSTSTSSQALPTLDSATSAVVNSISVVVELIRKNNSDYFEPYLFHTLRNRLILVQQDLHTQSGNAREVLEQSMKEMVDKMGVVHLGPLLEIMCGRLEEFQRLLSTPRSLSGTIPTTVGPILPLTLERYRICELFAELLHCSNMSLLNRSATYDHLYDSEGRLQGGLTALEELAQVIAMSTGLDRDRDSLEDVQGEVEPALELPITGLLRDSPSLDSDDSMNDEPGSSDEDEMDEISMYDETHLSPFASASEPPHSPVTISSSPISEGGSREMRRDSLDRSPKTARSPARSLGSRRSSTRRATLESSTDSFLPIGEQLKRCLLNLNLLSTLLDLFFEFPWNNFLHSTVYDLIHQILTGNVRNGMNRELVIALFRDARLMHRIVDGQKRNDAESAKLKGVRLGYMGHLTLISEDVISALERFPPDLRVIIIKYAPEPGWDQYVTGRYDETKKKDALLLGGGKPVVNQSTMGITKWKVDEGDMESSPGFDGVAATAGGIKGQFQRAPGGVGSTARASTADFGRPDDDDDDDDIASSRAPHFARYLAQEMQSSDNFGSSSDDEDDDEGWLSHSNFDMSAPPVSARHQSTERRPLGTSIFDDSFGSTRTTTGSALGDPFSSNDDDTFGPFSDSAAADGSEPFNMSSSFSDELEDSSFESFGDFGDFQSGEDGELTPTNDSWTFASDSSTGSGGATASPFSSDTMAIEK